VDLADELIAEWWGVVDTFAALQQLGAFPPGR
jgi:hypothetical protein